MATVLRDTGYHTAYFGKWHCGIVRDQVPAAGRANPNAPAGVTASRTPGHHRAGFQDWFGFESINAHFSSFLYEGSSTTPTYLEGFETDVLTDRFLDYLSGYERAEPLCAVLSYTPPHFPLIVPERWQRFDPRGLEVRQNFIEHLERDSPHPVPNPWNADNPMHAQTRDMRDQLALYYALIENLDHNIGRVLQRLEQIERFAGRRTLVVYFSDHGDFMGSHGLYDRKAHPHEESTRVPALFRWPGVIEPRGVRDELFGLVDLLPTVCGCAGIDPPVWTQGTDFSPLLLGRHLQPPAQQLLEMVGNPRWNLDFMDWRGLVTRRWKYAVYDTGHELLFDLDEDPYELRNLAGARPERRREMRRRLLAELRRTREPFFDVLMEHPAPVDYDRTNVSGCDYRILALETGWIHPGRRPSER
jgi:arylsulfatase A-like enzyme